jgi:hypothetical protein
MHGTVDHQALEPYLPESPRVGRTYPDLHEHIAALAEAGLLVVVDEPVNKDTEIHPLVRWQYRGGIPEEQRKAFSSRGRRIVPAARTRARCWLAGLPATMRSNGLASGKI